MVNHDGRTLNNNYFDLKSRLMDNIENKASIDSLKWKQLINYEYTIANILFFKQSF